MIALVLEFDLVNPVDERLQLTEFQRPTRIRVRSVEHLMELMFEFHVLMIVVVLTLIMTVLVMAFLLVMVESVCECLCFSQIQHAIAVTITEIELVSNLRCL